MENIIITPNKLQSSYEMFWKKKSPNIKNLHEFGEMGVVERHEIRRIREKFENRGKLCIYVGKVPDHTQDNYKLYNIETRRLHTSRNVTWLGKFYGDWKGLFDLDISIVEGEETEIQITNGIFLKIQWEY